MLKSGSSGLVSCEELLLLDVVESLLDVLLSTLLSLLLLVEEFDAVEEFIFEALLVFLELEELFELDELPALSPQPANVNKDKILTRATDFLIFIKSLQA